MLQELAGELTSVEQQIADLELRSLLSGEYDRLGAIVSIHPGAGGTESQDWAEMLFRMYMRWAGAPRFRSERARISSPARKRASRMRRSRSR
jgi:peptide chain release factor 2